MFSLTVQSGKHAGKKVKLQPGEVIVGRDEAARLRIASSDVSRQHCKLVVTEDSITVVELGSRNGTFIDGVPIHRSHVLDPGSTLTVGPMTFRLEGGTPPARRPEKARLNASDSKAAQGLSDDEIASLLTDEIPTLGTSDTTIGSENPTPLRTSAPRTPQPPKKTFRTVAEEAQEIIRLHQESLGKGGAAN
ncbi:FHA domain protein [Caulifigura coniformis]|uniref:FHA domain protein n=1 Tax=Caulifigura coniformis TaxID=2527983 RepID=A0A517S9S0_9PLAN|nr:FHA domain-containing protein [Caulifigura coniformis]QDT52874.1 FHA domain protein [Caulifigura coniformis]